MADIKTRESLHTVKTFDRVQNLAAKTRKLGEYEMSDLSPLILQKYVTELLSNGNLQTGEG